MRRTLDLAALVAGIAGLVTSAWASVTLARTIPDQDLAGLAALSAVTSSVVLVALLWLGRPRGEG
jgi:hypothetical protein